MGNDSRRISTTHVGALPVPDAMREGPPSDEALAAGVNEIVAKQLEYGIDLVNEGELTKGGNWVQFVNSRLSGFEPTDSGLMNAMLTQGRDWIEFADFYQKALAGGTLFEQTASAPEQVEGRRFDWVCRAPVEYVGRDSLEREIGLLKDALGDHPVGDAFLTTTAPQSVEVGRVNEYYEDDEAFVHALAEALRHEYEAIAAAGFKVQIDDAWLPALWDRIGIEMGLDAYKRYCMMRIEALNHALRNIPEEQVRYHLCWGSWHGPHAYDIPLADIVDVMLAVDAGTYLIEAANARHEHEYVVWDTVKLPENKRLAPGVVSHATSLIEHPELVARRIERFARRIGPDRVIASTDCGLGLRCHPQIAWAKLRALAEGAEIATGRLF